MSAQGFTAYAEEWWHFDHGDQFWGLVTGRPARYAGPSPRLSAGPGEVEGIPHARPARPVLGSRVSGPGASMEPRC